MLGSISVDESLNSLPCQYEKWPLVQAVDFDADITTEEIDMMRMMGIPFIFDTTQGKHVDDEAANAGAVKAKEKRRARQYMNRRGGFNRPLPAERTGETARRD